jgi:hypothetical protein
MRTSANRRCWTDASQRATLLWHRLHRHGVGRGTVVKPASQRDCSAPTFFGIGAVVSASAAILAVPRDRRDRDAIPPT